MIFDIISVGLVLLEVTRAFPLSSSSLQSRAASLLDCLNAGSVPIKLTTDSNYAAYQQDFNLRLSYKPAAIVLPTTNDEVSTAIKCAVSSGVKVQARSGGHGYGSYGTGGQDGSLIIDLENFNSVTLDTSSSSSSPVHTELTL